MDSSETNAPRLVSAMSVMAVLSLVFMLLRFVCKSRYGKPSGWDDYILAIAWLCLATYAGLTIASTKYGIGRHLAFVEPGEFVIATKLLYIGEFFAVICIAISKTSFAITLLRLATRTQHRVLIWGIIVSVNLIMWACAIFIFCQCTPVEKIWDQTVEGTCLEPHLQINYAIFAGSWSAAMDFVLAIFPWLLIWHLQMRFVEKVGVGIAMSLGILSGVTASIKTAYIMQSGRWSDFTFSSTDLLVWAASEGAVIIVAASIPFLRLALKEISNSATKSRSQAYKLGNVDTYKSRGSAVRTTTCVVAEGHVQKQDDQSDKSILGGTSAKNNGIVKTNEIMVEYGDCDVESRGSERQAWSASG